MTTPRLEDLPEVGGRSPVVDVEGVQVLLPDMAGPQGFGAVRGTYEPVGMVAEDVGAGAYEHRGDPYPGAPVRGVDAIDKSAQRAESVGELQPVADLLLEGVVHGDHVDGQFVPVDGLDVLVHVALGEPGDVLVPGTPAGRITLADPYAQLLGVPVGPAGECRVQAARAVIDGVLDRAVGGHAHSPGLRDRPDGLLVCAVDGTLVAVPWFESPCRHAQEGPSSCPGPSSHGLGAEDMGAALTITPTGVNVITKAAPFTG